MTPILSRFERLSLTGKLVVPFVTILFVTITLLGAISIQTQSRTLEKRLEKAMEGAKLLHPKFADFVPIKLGLSIAWQLVPHQRGGWANWDWSKDAQQKAYDRLLEPDKQFRVVGDQVSYLPGWQEGAVLSAHHVVE